MSAIPKLRFEEFNDGWKNFQIQDIGKIIRGASPRPKGDPRYYGGNVPRLMVQDVTRDKKYVTPCIDTLTEAGAKLSRPCKVGTLTIVCSGTVGVPSILAVDACIHDGFLAVIDIDKSETFEEFLYEYISRLQSKFDSSATHGGVFTNLTTQILREFIISLPSLPEQQKIASFLSSVDKKIDLLRQKKDALELYKKGLMQKIFSQEIRFKADDGNDFPEWEEVALGDLVTISKGKQINRDTLTVGAAYPVINGGVTPSGYHDEFNTEANSITISEGGNSCGHVDFQRQEFWCGGHCYVVKPIGEGIDNDFAFQNLKYRQPDVMRLRVGSGLPNIQKGDLLKLSLFLPVSIDEQQKIASFLSAIDSKIQKTSAQIEKMETFKKGLLQQMFV